MSTVAVIGMGNVGAACVYAMMIEGVANRYVLIDSNQPKARAHQLDLVHGQHFCRAACEISVGPIEACAGADVVVLTAGAKQRPGETRLDLAERNAVIVHEVVPTVARLAPGAVLLMVTNPVDVLTWLAGEVGVRYGLDRRRVIGSGTVLDTSRLRSSLAERLGVLIHNVHALVVGEHGDSEVVLWSSATVQCCPLVDFAPEGRPPLSESERRSIFAGVVGAAYEIVKGKGATSLAIGLTTARICRAVLGDERAVLTVSSFQPHPGRAGASGMDEPSCFSVPTIVGRGGALRVVEEMPMDACEREALGRSARIITQAYNRVRPA